jgi:ArpU family phage transcriptional regulator
MGAAKQQTPRTTKKWTKPKYIKEVEMLLYQYPLIKKISQEADYPSCVPVYEERTSPAYSEFSSTTEKYGLKRADNRLLIERIERGLSLLSSTQRTIIEACYFDRDFPGVIEFAQRHGLSRAGYHRLKKEALQIIAKSLYNTTTLPE